MSLFKYSWKVSGTLIAVWAMVPVIGCFLGFMNAVDLHGFGSGEAASWVQAGGSIIAIITAILIMNRQSAHGLHLHKLERLEADDDKLTAVFLLANAAHEMCEIALVNLQNRSDISAFLEVGYDYLNFERVQVALAAVPLHEIRSQGMIKGVLDILDCIDRIVRICEGSQDDPEFHLSDWNDVRDEASIIQRIESTAFGKVTDAVDQSRSHLRQAVDQWS